MVSAAGFGAALAKPVTTRLREYSDELGKLVKPEYGLAIGTLALAMTVFSFFLIAGLWKSRKWALWFVLILHLPGAIIAAVNLDVKTGAPILVVAVYCLLRVTGSVGPKM